MTKIKLKNGEEIKRHFWNEKDYFIDRENKVVKLSPQLHNNLLKKQLWGKFGFKKIGGSSIGSVCGLNPFGSKFQESIRIMWLGMPIFDKKYINAGVAIEPKILEAMEGIKHKSIDRFDPIAYEYDYFSDHETIGGLPDGILRDEHMVYEIKTTGAKNYDKWIKFGVPKYYQAQVMLYDYLEYGANLESHDRSPKIVACFLEEEDYSDPANVDIKKRKMKTFDVHYENEKAVQMIDIATRFRNQVMSTGASFPYDEEKDRDLLAYLECKNEEEYLTFLRVFGVL